MRNQRKKRLIHRGVQLALVRRLVTQWVIFVVAMATVTLALQYMLNPFQSAEAWSGQIKVMLGSMVLVAVCLAPVFIHDSIKLSHRVVGPVMRLQSAMKQLNPAESNERIRVRKNDFLREVVADYNDMLDRVESHLENQSQAPSSKA